MPDQASTRRPRTTRNSRGLRRSRTEREDSVESEKSLASVNSAAASDSVFPATTRRTRTTRIRSASPNPPNAATTQDSEPLPPSDPTSSIPEANSAGLTAGANPSGLASIIEEDPLAPLDSNPTHVITSLPEHAASPLVASDKNKPTPVVEEQAQLAGSELRSASPIPARAPDDIDQREGHIRPVYARRRPRRPPPTETELFVTLRRKEGHKFGRELYDAIEAGKTFRSCICPAPLIYSSKEEAEAGTGVFRFYKSGQGDSLAVFMRKGDNHWHCQCGTWCFEKTESTVDRKRKAEDTELELHKADCEDAAPGFVTVVRPVQEPENTETLWQIPIQSMWSSIAGCVKTMSSSVKEWFSKLGARLTKTAYEAVETRRYDETGSHLVVKRLKRQYCLPVASSSARQEEVLFEQLPYFEWADDATDRIGKHALESIKSAFWRQVLDIRRGYIAFKSSIDELKAQHKEGEFDLDLSIAIYNLMIRDFEDVSMTNYVAAAGQYEQGAMTVVSFIDQVYLESDILPALKEVFSKPPKQLDYFGDFEFKSRTRLAGDFLTWLLTQKDLFRIDESFQDALAKLVVDMDAIHKQEVLPSLVQFPGNNKPIMPGSFPLEDDILEVVPADKLIIEPVYECKHPDPRPPVSKPTAASSPASTKTQVQGEAEPWSIPKSILKKGTRKTVGNPLPRMQGTLTTPSRVRKLQFASPVARFTPPKRLPRTARVTKASSINNARTGLHGSPSGSRALSALTNIYHSTIKQAYQGTKYANFLNDTLRELYRRQDFSLPTISWPTKLHQNMQAKRQAWLKMSEEERQREMDLFVRDLELDDSGNVVRRQLLVPESELIIATRGLKDLRLANQVRREMEEAAEKERERMIKIIADEKRRKLEEEKRKIAEERRRLEEEEEKKRESERQKEEERLRAEQEAQRIREAEERAARRRLRAPTRAIIAPVTDEWRTRVLEIADSQPGVELTKTLEGQALTRRDFEEKLLPATAWLNDNVITGSILYIGDYVNRKLGATTQHPKCATFTSYFWPRLESAGPTQCGRLMRRAGVRKDNFLNIDSVLIPICKSSHWTLAVVLPSRRVIAHMDSLRGGHGDPYVTGLLREWVKATLQELYVEDEWEVVDFDAPMQLNGWDCGVFTITNGICMALGVDPKQSYSADQLTLQRHRLAAVLLNGGFQGDFDLDGV